LRKKIAGKIPGFSGLIVCEMFIKIHFRNNIFKCLLRMLVHFCNCATGNNFPC